MATTPEGKVKAKVSQVLQSARYMYYYMPVPGIFGNTTLDYVGCYKGTFFSIETKAPGKKPTERQQVIISQMMTAGAKVFVIDAVDCVGMKALKEWLGVE